MYNLVVTFARQKVGVGNYKIKYLVPNVSV